MSNEQQIGRMEEQTETRGRYPGLNLDIPNEEIKAAAERNIFGFWIFLMSDLIIFGLFFATNATMTNDIGFAGGPGPKELFNINSVALQTALLLISSLTSGFIAISLKYEPTRKRLAMWLALTALLGALFLFFELSDFAEMWALGGTPMRSGWLSSFYALVGLHGIHVTLGVIWSLVLIGLIARFGFNPRLQQRILVFVLYWHFLDVIWIGIFSFVFLRGLV